jgi:hypothetical protein
MQSDRKFHDYTHRVGGSMKVHREWIEVNESHSLTGLPEGSLCRIFQPVGETHWVRKTRNHGRGGSTRYTRHSTLQEALDAGQAWAWRKDEAAAHEARALGVKVEG